jgi:FKBP-type peptidyl-prolyl cis-trans isomerase
MKFPVIILSIFMALLMTSCGSSSKTTKAADPYENFVKTPSGLKYMDVIEGHGAEAKLGSAVSVKYVGMLEKGTIFDQTGTQKPLQVKIGETPVIKGWTEGLQGMKVGGKRKLVIPPELGYGNKIVGSIPANSVLIFEVELVESK